MLLKWFVTTKKRIIFIKNCFRGKKGICVYLIMINELIYGGYLPGNIIDKSMDQTDLHR